MSKTGRDRGDATSTLQTRKDPKDGFTRTAIVVEGKDVGSIDLVNAKGELLCRLNVSYLPESDGEEVLIVDTIDTEKRYTERRAIGFSQSRVVPFEVPKGGTLVSVDFRRKL